MFGIGEQLCSAVDRARHTGNVAKWTDLSGAYEIAVSEGNQKRRFVFKVKITLYEEIEIMGKDAAGKDKRVCFLGISLREFQFARFE